MIKLYIDKLLDYTVIKSDFKTYLCLHYDKLDSTITIEDTYNTLVIFKIKEISKNYYYYTFTEVVNNTTLDYNGTRNDINSHLKITISRLLNYAEI